VLRITAEFISLLIYQNLRSKFGNERHPYTKSRIGQIPCVCMYVCVTAPPKPLSRFE